MKYIGRFSTVFVTSVTFGIFFFYCWRRDGNIPAFLWLSFILIALIAYFGGRQYDITFYYSHHDNLTNLYNRRMVPKIFEKMSLRYAKGKKFFIMIIDCNNFKLINDYYGHEAGDNVLKHIGNILLHKTRKSDIAARWGGDEFLLIGVYNSELGLKTLSDRIREEIRISSDELSIPISISIGTSVFPDDHTEMIELIKLADNKMYQDKCEYQNRQKEIIALNQDDVPNDVKHWLFNI